MGPPELCQDPKEAIEKAFHEITNGMKKIVIEQDDFKVTAYLIPPNTIRIDYKWEQ